MNQPSFSPISTRLRETGTVLDSIIAQRRTRLPEMHEAYGHIDPLTLPRSTRSFEDALRTRRYDEKEGFQPRPSGPAVQVRFTNFGHNYRRCIFSTSLGSCLLALRRSDQCVNRARPF